MCIIGDMIPVTSYYDHDTVLAVLCLSGIFTMLILAILLKNFDAYLGHHKAQTFFGENRKATSDWHFS
jgi:hypothetical protein